MYKLHFVHLTLLLTVKRDQMFENEARQEL